MTENDRRKSEDTQWTVNTHGKFNFVVKCNFFSRNALQVAVDFTFFFVAVVISRARLVVRRNFSSFMSPFQSRVACRNLPYQGLNNQHTHDRSHAALIAQLGEYCTCNANVMGSNPVQSLKIFSGHFSVQLVLWLHSHLSSWLAFQCLSIWNDLLVYGC